MNKTKPTKSLVPGREARITGWYRSPNGHSVYFTGGMSLAEKSAPKLHNQLGVSLDAMTDFAKRVVQPQKGSIVHAASHKTGQIEIVRKPTHQTHRVHSGAGQAQSMSYPSQIVTPVSQVNRETHLLVPFGTAVLVSIPAFVASLAFFSAKVAGLIAFVVYLSVFIWRTGVADGLLHHVEEFAHIDLNGDGQIGDEPVSEVQEVVWRVSENGKNRQKVGVSPITPELKDAIAQKLAQNGQKWSRRQFVGHAGGHIVPHDVWVGGKYDAQGQPIKGIDKFAQEAGWVENGQLTLSGYDYFDLPRPNGLE